MGRREENAKATKLAIMRAATELIAEKGYEHVVVEDITRRARIAKGTFYNYYRQKDDVITELSNNFFARIEQQALNVDNFHSVIEGVSFYLENTIGIIYDEGVSRTREWVKEASMPSSLPKKFGYDTMTLSQMLKAFIDNGKLKKDTPFELLANMITTNIYGIIFSWSIDEAENPKEKVKYFNKMFLPEMLSKYQIEKEAS